VQSQSKPTRDLGSASYAMPDRRRSNQGPTLKATLLNVPGQLLLLLMAREGKLDMEEP
jgi:hypothetical protein